MDEFPTKLIFYGGVNKIGGNKILIKDSGESLFFDFGISFEDQRRYFAEYLTPRSAKGIGDYLFFKLIPNIPNLYRDDLHKPLRKKDDVPPVNGIFLTHPHLDHFGYISFIREDIPIFASDVGIKIIKSYESSSKGGIENQFFKIKKKLNSRDNYKNCKEINRPFNNYKQYSGSMNISFFELDHSVWGAGGYLIKTNDSNIFYTGDLRKHGLRANLTIQSLKELEKEEIDLLIIEGTNIGIENEEEELKKLIESLMGKNLDNKLDSELKLKERALEIIQKSEAPVFVDFGIRDFDRFLIFYEIAQKTNRKLVIPFKLAHHLYDLKEDTNIELFDSNLLIYKEPKRQGTFSRNDYIGWEKELLNFPNVVTFDEVKQILDKTIFVIDYFRLKNLIDLKPEKGIYLHSVTEPFNEEQALDFKRHLEWIKFFKLDYYYLHTSGHMSDNEIFETIEILNPKFVIPIHTQGIEIFQKKLSNVIIPKIGQEISLDTLKSSKKTEIKLKKDLYSYF